ncbi:MAG: PaaI family thioesterase [Pseudomonadota bacterium]|nr:PaaI family thioesterase [Pseudomonadota bacterium]
MADGYAAFTLFEAGADILTVEIKINYVTLAAGEALIARGEVIKSGRPLTIVRSEVSAVKDGVETLCAAGQGSLMTRKP